VSGIKPIFNSFFSGASEPAAQAALPHRCGNEAHDADRARALEEVTGAWRISFVRFLGSFISRAP